MHITMKRARICITYVHVHGRLGDMSIYMLGKVTYLGTGPLRLNRTGRGHASNKEVSPARTLHKGNQSSYILIQTSHVRSLSGVLSLGYKYVPPIYCKGRTITPIYKLFTFLAPTTPQEQEQSRSRRVLQQVRLHRSGRPPLLDVSIVMAYTSVRTAASIRSTSTATLV